MIHIRKEELTLYIWIALLFGILIGSAYTHWDIADSITTDGSYEPSTLGYVFHSTNLTNYEEKLWLKR